MKNKEDLEKRFNNILDLCIEENIRDDSLILPLTISFESMNEIEELINQGLEFTDEIYEDILTYGNLSLIKLFLDKKADNSKLFELTTIIQKVKSDFIFEEKNISTTIPINYIKTIIDLCIDYGADINSLIDIGEDRFPIIFFPCILGESEIVEYLIELGADINIKYENGISLLFFSLLEAKYLDWDTELFYEKSIDDIKEVIKVLMDNGADINQKINFEKYDLPLIALACLMSDIEIIEYLIGIGADIDIQVESMSLLFYVLMMNEKFLNIIIPFNEMNIFDRFDKKRYEMAQLFINNGADVNYINEDMPFLELLLINKETRKPKGSIIEKESILIQQNTFINDRLKILKFLIDNGADVNIKDKYGNTPLFYAFKKNNIEMCQILLEKGADVNYCSILKTTNLMLASSKNNFEMVQLLVKYQADIHIEDIFGVNACSMTNNLKIIKLLKQQGSKRDRKKYNEYKSRKEEVNLTNNDLEVINELRKKSEEFNRKSEESKKNARKTILERGTPMSEILKYKNTTKLKQLIKRGYDTSYTNLYDLINEKYPTEFIEAIIKNGTEINTLNQEREETALILAVKQDNIEIVKLLIQYGVNPEYKMPNGDEAFDFVVSDEMEDLLLNAPTFKTHQPQNLIKILTNFTIDTPIKYSTHLWDFGDVKKEYGSFQGFMEAIKNQWQVIEYELKELSPNLHDKIYNFLINDEPNKSWCSQVDINIGWSSLEGLDEWCDGGNNPFEFKLDEEYEVDGRSIGTFGEVISLFKQEIEIRNENNVLEEIFLEQKKKLGRGFKTELKKLKGKSFYTDVEIFKNSINRIFNEIRKRPQNSEIEVEAISKDSKIIEIKIIQLNSQTGRDASDMLDEVKDGDFKILKDNFQNLCDWSIESAYEDRDYRINYLRYLTTQEIESLDETSKGFTHILRFYK